jgi:hypothetical protein
MATRELMALAWDGTDGTITASLRVTSEASEQRDDERTFRVAALTLASRQAWGRIVATLKAGLNLVDALDVGTAPANARTRELIGTEKVIGSPGFSVLIRVTSADGDVATRTLFVSAADMSQARRDDWAAVQTEVLGRLAADLPVYARPEAFTGPRGPIIDATGRVIG